MSDRMSGVTPRAPRRNPLFFFSVPVAVLLFLGALACGNKDRQSQPSPGDTTTPQPITIALKRVDEAGITRAVRQHNGKVVVLDVWATWCGPCIEEFPRLARWREEYNEDALAVVTVSLDDEEEIESKLMPFLRTQNTEGLDLLLYIGGDHDKMVNSIDPDWPGEVPALFLYDRSGTLAVSLPGEHEAAEIESHIERLLAAAGG